MQIAQIKDGVITAVQSIQRKPIYDGGRWWDLRDSAVLTEWKSTYGWVEVVEVSRPADTATDTYNNVTVELVDGIPTQVWTSRPWTAEGLARQAADKLTTNNETTVGNKIETVDMPAMKAILDTTNATINGGPAPYIKDIARAVRRLDRKVQRLLEATD